MKRNKRVEKGRKGEKIVTVQIRMKFSQWDEIDTVAFSFHECMTSFYVGSKMAEKCIYLGFRLNK